MLLDVNCSLAPRLLHYAGEARRSHLPLLCNLQRL